MLPTNSLQSIITRLGNKQGPEENSPLMRSKMPLVITQNCAQMYTPGAKIFKKTQKNAPGCDILFSQPDHYPTHQHDICVPESLNGNTRSLNQVCNKAKCYMYMYRVSQKKLWCRKLKYFTNGAIYQCNISRHGTYNFHLGVCKVSIQYIMSKVKLKLWPWEKWCPGQNGLGW